MVMRVFKDEQVREVNLNESGITCIRWINQENDLEIEVDWNGQTEFKEELDFNNIKTRLIFDYITDLDIQLKYTSIGALEVTQFEFEKEENAYWIHFRFNFHPVGHIRFKCNSISFVVENPN